MQVEKYAYRLTDDDGDVLEISLSNFKKKSIVFDIDGKQWGLDLADVDQFCELLKEMAK